MKFFLSLILIAGSLCLNVSADSLETIAQWSYLEYALPYDRGFREEFRPENNVATGIEVSWHRIFLSVPRLRAGVPSTLNFIPRNIPLGSSPQLQAYPSWEWHSAGKGHLNCSELISVYRTRIDSCNRLWVLDSGIVTSIDFFTPVCAPKILIFDLQTDLLVRYYTFPRESLRPNSLLTNFVIDEATGVCDNAFVYITDTAGPGLIVFDGSNNTSWRFLHASMFPHPDYTIYQIADETFELMDGIVGLAFSQRHGTLYYQPLATDRLFGVPTSVLQAGPLPFGEQLPVTLIGRKSSQGLALVVDPQDDTILFSPLRETAIASWQPQTNNQRIVVYNPEKLQFVAELRWMERDNGQIWVMSTRFQKFFNRRTSPHEINIRIMRIVPDAVISKSLPLYPYVDTRYSSILYNNTVGF